MNSQASAESGPSSSVRQRLEKAKDIESDIILYDDNITNRNNASTYHKASWISCYFNLTCTIMGAGILGLPNAFSRMGWIPGYIFLVLACICSGLGLHLLALCSKKLQSPSSFFDVAQVAVIGYSWIIDIIVAALCFGISCTYLIIVGDLMPSTMNYFQSYDILQSRSLWIFIGFILSTLLSFMPSFDALGWTSSLSVIFILIVTVIVVLYAHPEVSSLNPCPESASSNINHDSRQDCQGSTASNVFTLHAIKFIPVFLFSFTCHQNIFNVINELASPTIFRIDMIIVASMGTVLAVYLTVCTAVYMTYGDKTKSNLLNNYPEDKVNTIIRVMMSLIVIFNYPLQIYPARSCLMSLLNYCCGKTDSVIDGNELNLSDMNQQSSTVKQGDVHSKDHKKTQYWKRFYTITIIYALLSLVVASTFHDLSFVFALLGGSFDTFIALIFPALSYTIMYPSEYYMKLSAFTLFCVGFTVWVISCTMNFNVLMSQFK